MSTIRSRARKLVTGLDVDLRSVMLQAPVAFLMKVSAGALTFGLNVVLARALGADGVGIYFLGLTVVTIASMAGIFGVDTAALRFSAAGAERGEWSKVAGLRRQSVTIVAGLSAVVAVSVVAGVHLIAGIFGESGLAAPLRVMAVAVVPMSMTILYARLLKGLRRIPQGMFAHSVAAPLVGLPLAALLAHRFGIQGAVAAHVIAWTAALGLALAMWRGATPHLRSITGDFDRSLLIATSFPLFGVAVMNVVMQWADVVMLGIWWEKDVVGTYAVAMRTAALISFIHIAAHSVLAPRFSALHATGRVGALGALARNSSVLLTLAVAPLLAVCFLVPGPILSIFGDEFPAAASVLKIVAIGQFVNVATGAVGHILTMTGFQRSMRNNMLLSAVVFVAANVLLIPRYGAVGAAWAFTASLVFKNLTQSWLVHRKLGIVVVPFPQRAPSGEGVTETPDPLMQQELHHGR